MRLKARWGRGEARALRIDGDKVPSPQLSWTLVGSATPWLRQGLNVNCFDITGFASDGGWDPG